MEKSLTRTEKTRILKRHMWQKTFLESLAQTCNITLSCKEAEIPRSLAYKYRYRYKKFRKMWDDAITEGVELLEAEARRRALDGVEEAIFHRGEIVGWKTNYSDTLMVLLLKAHRPDKYRDNLEVKHKGKIEHEHSAIERIEFIKIPEIPSSDMIDVEAEELEPEF